MWWKQGLLVLVVVLAQRVAAEPTPDLLPKASEVERRFQLADRDGDGALSRAEATQAGWLVEHLDRFEGIDRDRSGTVTLAEIGTAIAAQVQEWLGADSDRDGRVTESEAKRAGSLADAFRRGADADRDGALTRQEYEGYSQRGYYSNSDLPSVAPNIIDKRF